MEAARDDEHFKGATTGHLTVKIYMKKINELMLARKQQQQQHKTATERRNEKGRRKKTAVSQH